MKLRAILSFLILFFVGHGCKQVYEVDVSRPVSEKDPYHLFFINKNLDDNLGVMVTDTNTRELNLFYGDKNSEGSLINLREVVTYLPESDFILSFEFDDSLLPKKLTASLGDTTTTMVFKNYDLKANTVDVDIFDAQSQLIQSRAKIWCGEALLKFGDAKKQFDQKKGLRTSATADLDGECSPFLNSMITAADGIGCFASLVALPFAAAGSLTGVGLVFLAADMLLAANTCSNAVQGLTSIFKGECLQEDNWVDDILEGGTCAADLFKFVRRLTSVSGALRLREAVKDAKKCGKELLENLVQWYNGSVGPILPGDPATTTSYMNGGRSYGDPNIVTFDGKSYGFNGVGEFVAVKSTVDNFEIQVRQEELRNRSASGNVSWNTGLAINTGSDRLCFYPDKYYINGQEYAYNPSIYNMLQNGGSITGDLASLSVAVNGDVVKIFIRSDAIDYSVLPGSKRQGKMIGIFGDFNGSEGNDLRIRNGAVIDGTNNTLYPAFTDSWRISQAQSLFVYDAGKNTQSYTDPNFPRAPFVITESQRASAGEACRNAGVLAPFLEGCINDVVATGDASLAARAKDLQDENTLRSFDIKFGPDDDKRLLKRTFAAGQYGSDYVVCNANDYPEINGSISVVNGFETVVYFASESPNPNPAGVYFNLGPYEWNWSVSSANTPGDYSFYDPLLYLIKEFNSKILIFDGKVHKLVIQSSIDLTKNTGTYKIFFDDVLVSENGNFAIRRYRPQKELVALHPDVSLTFKNNVRLYRWSFKSY
ncbi:VWD domain-containing protein [Dyadobacter sp. CY261]|uniref:VWD domain-containing protein n=1 Tax=Dyadobacter sp. CY261 TaxID=2907203 RepID=UPI001F43BF0D|nr:VWD domain-containing protein [Dyadobacter sp. CY261]MCF0074990.1 VWD domain-containing protein [Dyadobacter sp. CY261]